MKWLELKIDAAPAGLDPVSALLEDLGITGLVIDDEGDFRDFLEHNRAYWDYVDDALMQEKKGLCRITFYLEDSPDGYNTLSRVRMALSRVKQEHPEYGSLLLTMENMEDADWENNWKQFYKPMEIGDRLIVIPEWESAGVPEGRVALRLNPGLTFGTGSHATTRLCLTALEKHVRGGETVLDLGCGSGILSIAALLLGLVGGYPVGARTAAELVRRGELSPAEGARLLTFCNNAGPAFAIGVAGVSVFGSARTGVWLYLLHCAAALLTGLLFCRRPLPVTAMPKRPVPPRAGLTGQFLRAVEGAVSAMARVCGFVVFFLVLLRLAEGLIGPLPPLAAGVLELTNGILRLTPDRRGFVTAAALLGWGGLSVHCQTAAVTAGSGISLRLYVPAKAVQAALSAGLAALLAPYLLP